ncbi:hypothetical protein AArcCO_1601 [Halalkaliarchaeum sp. AArc-CO]|nr:hypothetical protein AArcCO_1601 [Halalkaliarchaeum sp. AArc-CO]
MPDGSIEPGTPHGRMNRPSRRHRPGRACDAAVQPTESDYSLHRYCDPDRGTDSPHTRHDSVT